MGAEATSASSGTPAPRSARPVVRGLSEIYRFARSNHVPLYFVSPTPYNILGVDQWIGSFEYVSYFDTFDGLHPHSFVPRHAGPQQFESFESVNSHLLGNKEVVDRIRARGGGKVLFVMFDEETEALAGELGLEIALPPRDLREHLDSKVVTTRLGNDAGVASAPNCLGRAETYRELREVAHGAGLGDDLVVQTPYGDSGRTTFFIATEDDWEEHHEDIVGQDLKIMRRIEHLPGTLEAVATRHGTLVGPIQTDITGFEELTPYPGGWCGNDLSPDVFDVPTRARIREMASRLGEALFAEGYRGVFCLDFLVETPTGEVYLGEVNPRISGASPLTNLVTSKYGGAPLFLFHLLEFLDCDWEADLDRIQRRWDEFDAWSQLVLKQTDDTVELITEAPPTGLWRMDADGELGFLRPELAWHAVGGEEDEAFYFRVYGKGEYRYPGADLGVVVARGRMQTDDRQLTPRAKAWAAGIGARFAGVPPEAAFRAPAPLDTKWF
ncbi:MAG: hypothetical protein U0R70_15560 [Solirubrobacteraceae bacterium]